MTARRWVAVLIALGAACLFVSAVALGAGVLYLTRRTTTAAVVYPVWQDPTTPAKLKLDPQLSVATLAGTGDAAAISAMLARGELDSAYMTALYSTRLTDRQRLAQLQLIGGKYAAAQKTAPARQVFQSVLDIAALSPSLSDFDRADALAQGGAALYLAKDPALAGLMLDAGDTIALASPYLKDANRYVLLGRLLAAAQGANDTARIQRLNADRARFVDNTDPNPAAPAGPADPLPAIETPAADAALTTAQGKVISAALSINALPASNDPVPSDMVDALANALFGVDDQWTRIAGASTSKLTLSQKVALQRAHVEWLTIKERVARKAYGFSIVPEWEDGEPAIRSALAKAYDDLNVLRTEQSVALPQTKDIDLAQSYLLRSLILAGRLGQYPDFPEADLVAQMNDSTDTLIGDQPSAALRVKVENTGDHFFYHLVNDDNWYGRASPAATAAPQPRGVTPTRRPAATAAPSTPAPAASARPGQNATAVPAAATKAPAGAAPTNTAAAAAPTNTAAAAPPTNTAVPPPAATNTPVPPPPATNTAAPPPPQATPTRRAYP